MDEQLTLEAARKKLGLGPADHVADYLPQWQEVEQRLVGLANREQDEEQLTIYNRDLAALRQTIATLEKEAPKKKRSTGLAVWGVCVLCLAVGGFYAYEKWGKNYDPALANAERVAEIESIEQIIGKRRWNEAEKLVYAARINGADKAWVRDALARIDEGRNDEGGQQLGYFIGGAQAALEAARIDEAKSYLQQARELAPEDERVAQVAALIKKNEIDLRVSGLVSGIELAISEKKWATAEGQLFDLSRFAANHPEIDRLQDQFTAAQAKAEAAKKESLVLLQRAEELDQGAYSAEALRILEQAMRLDPSDPVRAAYQRMSAYGRFLQVPGEFATIAAALKEARPRDRVQVAAGTYREKLRLPPGVILVGEGREKTIIEIAAAESSVLTIDQAGARARVSSMTLRHQGLVNDSERFSVVAVSGGSLRLEDVSITKASGHGVAVVEGGSLEMVQSEISRSGWDGVSVQGDGSTAKLTALTSRENLHHGIDFWEGGSGSVINGTLVKNGRAGLVAISENAAISVVNTVVKDNRELGILISGALSATVTNCSISGNALGGMVLQDQVQNSVIEGNRITKNREAGLVVEQGSQVSLSNNTVNENTGRQLWQNAVFPTVQEIEVDTPPVPAPRENN